MYINTYIDLTGQVFGRLVVINKDGRNKMLIYLVTNRKNGKKYIGQTIGNFKKRKREHITEARLCRVNNYFHSALRKYGSENFDWEVLHDYISSINDLNRLEIYYIRYYNTFGKGYNLDTGGGNAPRSDETKQKISISKTGKKHSEKSKRKMSEACKGKNNPMYGKYGKDNPAARTVIINNQMFGTRKEAAEFVGINPSSLRYRILHKTKWMDYYYDKKK